jgi:hypothetical protein
MRMRILMLTAIGVMLVCAVPVAEAGALRYLGHKIKGGSQQAATATTGAGEKAGKASAGVVVTGADATKQGAEAVGGGAAAAGTATADATKTGAGAVKEGAVTVAKGAEEAPGAAAHGVTSGAKAVWKAVW